MPGTSTSQTDTYNFDYVSGQNAANQRSDESSQLQASYLSKLMEDPVAALAQSKRIHQLQQYLNAYRGNYQLPDQEVLPRNRMASSQHSFTSRTET